MKKNTRPHLKSFGFRTFNPNYVSNALLAFLTFYFLITNFTNAMEISGIPEVWIGTSPFCDASPQDCQIMGLDFIRKDSKGDGISCLTGEKVLCRAPEKPLPSSKTDESEIRVLAYNIFGRQFIVSHDGQVERTCRIPRAIAQQFLPNKDIDVIAFSEAFTPGCWEKADLKTLLKYYGWKHSTNVVAYNSEETLNGGIFIASKWPILDEDEEIFKKCKHADCFVGKGVKYARIRKTQGNKAKVYHIFATHLQAWDDNNESDSEEDLIRKSQAEEIEKFVKKKRIPNTEPVIFAGDFNTHIDDIENFLIYLEAEMPTRDGILRNTVDPDNNPLDIGGKAQWLDYVFYSANHEKPTYSSMESIQLLAEKPFEICSKACLQPWYVFPDSIFCNEKKTRNDLSDHYPVLGTFDFDN